MKEDLVAFVDGSYYIYSVYYALPNLVNSFGEPTSVIYGCINILRSIFIKYKPKYMIVVFDAPGNTFRDDLFQEYKLFRKSAPPDLLMQIPVLYEIIKAIGWSLVIVTGVEADDVIGTLSVLFVQYLQSNCVVYIFSGDKDMMQLIRSNVFVISTRFNIFFTSEKVKKKFGVSPNLMVDYLSLLGDSSDNIPGVPGIGEVTSRFLLQQIGGVDVIYKNLEKIPLLVGLRGAKTIFLKLQKYRFLAFLSYRLVTIKKDVCLNMSCDDLSLKSLDIDLLVYFFQRYEFKKWLVAVLADKWLK